MTELELTRQFFDEKAEIWDSHDRMKKEQRLHKILSKIIPELNSPVLDMGSGTGILVPVLDNIIDTPDQVVEFDISRSMLSKTKDKYRIKNNINFVQSDAHILPFIDKSFASIVCFAVYPHFHSPMKAVQEFHRVLNDRGIFIILHLMGHRELNAMHEEAGSVVCRHALQPVGVVSRQIAEQSFNIIDTREQEDLYLIVAQKQGLI
jgi:ubiquinone/menaquinone biosynthesis C-methylase UbiE